MSQILNEWPTIDIVFLLCAVVGGVAFLAWVVMQFVGGDLQGEVGEGPDFDASEASGGADMSFTLLSFQGLSSFLTMFGLVGLAAHREGEVSSFIALGLALVSGLALSWAIGKLFATFNSLQSSGTLRMESAVGQEGTVYLTLPEAGEGKVQLTMQGRFQVVPAVADNSERIETGTRVKVLRVNDGHTLVVAKL
jgi:membrane protein implicated in regulation of membrane protease activity